MGFSKRVLAIVLFFIFCFLFSTKTFAQTTTKTTGSVNQSLITNTNPDVPKNLHTYTQNILIEVMSAFSCQLAGIDIITKSNTCLEVDHNTNKIGYIKTGGVLGFLQNGIAQLYNPPIHLNHYFKYLSSNFGLTSPVYAQTGVGITSLYPLTGIWIAMRNIAYLILILIFIFIGLGIMLRVRIDPRTVMSIQNQIPKILVGIILITLSFAIAGFLIDLMWIVMFLAINTLTNIHPQILDTIKPSSYVTTFSMSDVAGGFFGIANGVAAVVGGTIYNTFNPTSISGNVTLPSGTPNNCGFLDIGCMLSQGIGGIISGTIGSLLNFIVGGILGLLVGSFVWFVVIIAILFSLFKLWFALLKAYILIIFYIIFAPLLIIAGLIPSAGPGVGFGAWVKNMLGNLMAFPVIISLFLLAKIIADGFSTATSTSSSGFFMPPLLGNPGGSFGAVIAFGIIMMSPAAVDIVKAAFRAPSISTGGVGDTLRAGQAVVLPGYQRGWRGMTRRADDYRDAGPFRKAAAVAITTRPLNYFRGRPIRGTSNPATLGERRDQINKDVTNNPSRIRKITEKIPFYNSFSREEYARKIVAAPDQKKAVPSPEANPGGAKGEK